MVRTTPTTRDVLGDVAVRFREHDQYGTEQRAAQAIARRLKLPLNQAQRLLAKHLAILDTTIRIIDAAPKVARGRVASPEDLDWDDVRRRLRSALPDVARLDREAYIGWVVFWHYLK